MADQSRPSTRLPSGTSPSRKISAGYPARISPARRAAFEILLRVATTSAHSDDLLHGPGLSGLSQPDRDLATALVLGVLRWQIALDARLRPLLSRPDMSLAEPVAIALRLGLFQLSHMERIPPHAALNESVELVRSASHEHAAGMVNAILRKVAALPPIRKPLVETTVAMAQRLAHPHWLVEGWAAQYGRPAAEAICEFDQLEPRCVDLFTPLESEGGAPMMDAGSRLVAELAAKVGRNAQRVWDCCAAPGGKTLVLAARLQKAELLATDTSPVRAKRLADRLTRYQAGQRVQVQQADAAALPLAYGAFDLILCDVPCSGTGTLARNPEIRHRLEAPDLQRQAARQTNLLRAALGRLHPGGSLVYSTCSLEAEECERVVDSVLDEKRSWVSLEPMALVLDELAAEGMLTSVDVSRWTSGPFLRTLPGAGFQGDGFFAALLRKA